MRKFRCIENITDQMGNVYIEKGQILTIEEFKQFWKENNFVGNLYEKICIKFQEITPAEEILKELIEENIIELEEIKNQERTYGISIKHSKEDQSYFFDDDFNYLKQLLGEEE